MKKFRLLQAATLFLLLLLSGQTLAAQPVRVGLYYNSVSRTHAVLTSASLSNQDGLAVSLLLSEPVPLPLIYTQAEVVPLGGRSMVQIAAVRSADEALAAAREARGRGLNAFLVYRADGTALPFKAWVEGITAVVGALGYPGAFTADTQGDLLLLNPSGTEPGVIIDGRLGLSLTPRAGRPARVAAPGQFTRNYEGSFELSVSNGGLGIVNVLSLESYVACVVPFEMSDSWPLEALKAQAVAARSYAEVNRNKHRALRFDLCDSPACCQKYAGFDERFVNSRRAVSETAGRVARFNGRVAELFYHSNSGGQTENSEDVWTNMVPYARALADPLSIAERLIAHLLSRANNNTEFPARWQRTWRREELETVLRQTENMHVGTILAISSRGRSAGGRHTGLVVRGTAGEAPIERNRIRPAFSLIRQNPQGGEVRESLPSTLFEIVPLQDTVSVAGAGGVVREVPVGEAVYVATPEGARPLASSALDVHLRGGSASRAVSRVPLGFTFDGRGWGHGVGMSQWGAFEKARQGFTFEQILNFYFQGITIE
jgi:SpoIID/LytB domain protein